MVGRMVGRLASSESEVWAQGWTRGAWTCLKNDAFWFVIRVEEYYEYLHKTALASRICDARVVCILLCISTRPCT